MQVFGCASPEVDGHFSPQLDAVSRASAFHQIREAAAGTISVVAGTRIKQLLGLEVSGDEPPSSFTLDKYQAMKAVSIYRPELDLVVLTDDGEPAACALGWFEVGTGSVLFEPVGTAPEHARKGLSRAVCEAVMDAAAGIGATIAVVGPRGDDAYPVPRRLYESMGFTTIARAEALAWS